MTRMYVNARVRLQHLTDRFRNENGQGTLEYLGIVIVAGLLILAVTTAVNEFKLDEKLGDEFDKVVKAGQGGAGGAGGAGGGAGGAGGAGG